jgi:menaquinone-9 beta-reductase
LTPAEGVEGTNYTANKGIPFIGGLLEPAIVSQLEDEGTVLAQGIGDSTIEVPTIAEIEQAIGDFFHQELESRDFISFWMPESVDSFNVDDVTVKALNDALVIALNAGGGANVNAMTNFIPAGRDIAIALSGSKTQEIIDQARLDEGMDDASLPKRFNEGGKDVDLTELDVFLTSGAIRMEGEVTVIDAILGSIDVDADFWVNVGLRWEPNAALNADGVQMMEHVILDKDVDPEESVAFWIISIILARQAGLVATPADEMGFAIRGYYSGLHNLSGLLEIYLPLMDPSDHYLLPSYGWVFPTGPHSANIGVGLFQRVAGVNIRQLMVQFLEFLQKTDRRFADIQALGNWLGAPLRFDFQPNRCTKPGLALVGDAAGMISPFTGEGISYAIESGKLAAQVIHTSLSDVSKSGDIDAGVDLSEYGRQLGRHYIGYFEAGRQSARRYLLMWRVLESTFRNEKPLYAMCRQAALFPEGLGESYANALMEDVSILVGDASPTLASDLLVTNETLADTVRHDWPFLVRAVRADLDLTGIPFRPALLVCLAAYLGQPQRSALHLAGAAIEQGYLAAIAQLSVEEETPQNGTPHSDRKANWGNMFALMVGDFLMSKAFELSAQIGAIVSHEIAAALAIASEGQVRELREAYNHKLAVHQHVDILGQKIATLFELPCRLGARLGMLPPAQVAALAKYGRHFGLAYQIVEDYRSFTPQVNGQTWPILADPRQGIYSLPVLYALQSEYGQKIQQVLRRVREEDEALAELTTYVQQSGALEQTKAIAFANAEQAQAQLKILPDNGSLQSLYQLAAFSVERLNW